MSIKVVLFDLDGTLLPMDQDKFTGCYFKLLAGKLAAHGYEPQELIKEVWNGTRAMIKNSGKQTNEAAFWESFTQHYGPQAMEDIPFFEEFYCTDFEKVRESCGFDPRAAQTVAQFKEKGLRLALATNPIFPQIATRSRIRWAGLNEEDFEFYTTYENSRFCKPNIEYYYEVMERAGTKPQECLMVGNDVSEDMIARQTGMKVFLLTDCIINKEDKDIHEYPQGSFEQLLDFVGTLL